MCQQCGCLNPDGPDLDNDANFETKLINPCISVEIINSSDPSIQCINALKQVMDFFQKDHMGGDRSLSPLGKDTKAVYAWFCERYNQDIKIKIS